MSQAKNNIVKAIFMGDISVMHYEGQMDPAHAKNILSDLKPLLDSADVRVANLENPITEPISPIAKCGPNIWQTEKDLLLLKEAGIDCAGLANNHTGDFGEAGVENTIRVLEAEGFGYTGAGKNIDEAYKPWYQETEAGTLAICAFCENEFGCATLDKWGAAGFDTWRIARTIREAREHADFVIIFVHGGNEENPLPSPGMCSRYRSFVELGADAVIGAHSHCMQGMEIYRGAPIFYSMGNFYFPAHVGRVANTFGYMVELSLKKGEKPAFQIHPYRLEKEKNLLFLCEGEEKEKVFAYLDTLSAIIADEQLLQRYFDGWSLLAGPGLIDRPYKEEYLEEHHLQKGHPMLGIRNIRTCEAHHEVVTNFCRMIVEDRVAGAKEMVPLVRKLQDKLQ